MHSLNKFYVSSPELFNGFWYFAIGLHWNLWNEFSFASYSSNNSNFQSSTWTS